MSLDHAADTVIDRFYDALSRGDLEAARACCAPDALFWHSFDQQALDLEEASRSWAELVSTFEARAFIDVRREAIEGGYVQRHTMVLRPPGGAPLAWPVCLFATVRDGLIVRIDEYLDRAGAQPLAS